MEDQQPKFHISTATKDRVEACKQYIERKYTKLINDDKLKKENWAQLSYLMNNLNFTAQEQITVKQKIVSSQALYLRQKRQKVTADDFEPISIIGRGAFGEVRVCKDKLTGEVVAVKKMSKSEMIVKNQLGHIRAEREILSSSNIPWIVELMYSFQDERHLYLVMEFLQGGDLMTLLIKQDILSEQNAKFYIAELVLAVDAVHKMNFIHRDIKPDNVLVDNSGHLKLSDFGLCKYTEIKPRIDFGKKEEDIAKFDATQILTKRKQDYKRNRKLAYSTVGTPDYIAPEVFSQKGYTETVDWWSVGVILFEMVIGYPPFFSDDPKTTCQKIIHWKKTFQIPPDANVSPQCADLIKKLMADQDERLGINGVEEIKIHPFFSGVDWKRIREKKPPFIPDLTQITSNFDKFEEEEPWTIKNPNKKVRKGNHFIGYSFNRHFEKLQSPLGKALQELENMKPQAIRVHFNLQKQSPSEIPRNQNSQHKLEEKRNFQGAKSQSPLKSSIGAAGSFVNQNFQVNSKLLNSSGYNDAQNGVFNIKKFTNQGSLQKLIRHQQISPSHRENKEQGNLKSSREATKLEKLIAISTNRIQMRGSPSPTSQNKMILKK